MMALKLEGLVGQFCHEVVRSVILLNLMMHLGLLLFVWDNGTWVDLGHHFKACALKVTPADANGNPEATFSVRSHMTAFSSKC